MGTYTTHTHIHVSWLEIAEKIFQESKIVQFEPKIEEISMVSSIFTQKST